MAAAPILPILAGVSTAVSAVGAIKQGRAESRAATYNAQVAEQDAVIARQQAQQEAAQIDRENRMRQGAITAKAGAAGVGMSGSVLDVLGDVVAQGELERQNAIYQGELSARGSNQTATMERKRAKTAKTASYFKAGETLLSGATRTYTLAREG